MVNGNNDLSYNSGSLLAIDVDAFFSKWLDDDGVGIYPYCETLPDGSVGRCVLDAASTTDAEHPCRRLPTEADVVECDERPFVVDAVPVGDFATVPDVSYGGAHPRVWIPVRGDPSVTFIDVVDGPDGSPDLDCGQERDADGWAADDARCRDFNRLTHLRNDPELLQLPREPYNIQITETDDYRYAFVAHSAGPYVSVIDLDGLLGVPERPAIVDSYPLFQASAQNTSSGGFGLAVRPCSVAEANAPGATRGCTRPMVYASYRYQLTIAEFTVAGLSESELPPGAYTRDSCYGPDDNGDGEPDYVGVFCATPDQLDQPCAVVCEPEVTGQRVFFVGGIDPFASTSSSALGDIAFSDASGEHLYAVETNPGGLLELDTSLDLNGIPRNVPAGPPIEICDKPTRMKIWDQTAFVTCFQAAYVFVVDLRSARVIKSIQMGTGPHDLVVDPGRQVLYAANTLEASISVIDLDPTHRTRYEEIARIGLQEPYSQ